MLKKGLKVIAFMLIVVLLWNHLTMKFRPDGLHPVYREPEDSLDLILVGSSAWYTFWSPMLAYETLGVTSFDYAQGGMPADLIEYCIKEICKYQNPQVVAIDARVFQYRESATLITAEDGSVYLDDGYIRTVADTMPNGLNRFRMLYSVHSYLQDGWANYLDLLFYHDRYQELLAAGGSALYAETTRDFTKGFDFHGEVTPFGIPQDFSTVYEVSPLSEGTTRVIERLCEYCEAQDFRTVFVVMPLAEMSEEEKRQYNYMQQVISGYDGIAFLNTNDHIGEIGIDYAGDFSDGTHGNYSGAQKFTAYFSNWLSEWCGLPDRRGDPDYEFWQEDDARWQQFLGYVLPQEN